MLEIMWFYGISHPYFLVLPLPDPVLGQCSGPDKPIDTDLLPLRPEFFLLLIHIESVQPKDRKQVCNILHDVRLLIARRWKSPDIPSLLELNHMVSMICIYEKTIATYNSSLRAFECGWDSWFQIFPNLSWGYLYYWMSHTPPPPAPLISFLLSIGSWRIVCSLWAVLYDFLLYVLSWYFSFYTVLHLGVCHGLVWSYFRFMMFTCLTSYCTMYSVHLVYSLLLPLLCPVSDNIICLYNLSVTKM